jgi:hypothetical protein
VSFERHEAAKRSEGADPRNGLGAFFIAHWSRIMEDQRATLLFSRNDDLHATAVGRALWQSVRRPQRSRISVQPETAKGPYETSYSISTGYPDREIVLP